MTADSFATAQAEPAPFEVHSGPRPAILLHGIDIAADVSGYQIIAQADEPYPEVVLRLAGNVTHRAVFEGLAHVAIADVVTEPGPAAAAFLSQIDPGELEKAALNRPDLGSDSGALTAAMLTQLQEWANGRA